MIVIITEYTLIVIKRGHMIELQTIIDEMTVMTEMTATIATLLITVIVITKTPAKRIPDGAVIIVLIGRIIKNITLYHHLCHIL